MIDRSAFIVYLCVGHISTNSHGSCRRLHNLYAPAKSAGLHKYCSATALAICSLARLPSIESLVDPSTLPKPVFEEVDGDIARYPWKGPK